MPLPPSVCPSCSHPLRTNAPFCAACGAPTRPTERAVRPVASVPARNTLLVVLAALAALAVLIAGISVWQAGGERAPASEVVVQRTETPPGMSSQPAGPVSGSAPDDIDDRPFDDESVEVPPDAPAPTPPSPRPPRPASEDITVLPEPSPRPSEASRLPALSPDRRDAPPPAAPQAAPPPPSPPPSPPEMDDDGPLWDAYASARANAASPGMKDPAVMRSEFCAAAARTLRDGQGRNVGRIRNDQRRFGC